MSLSAEKSDIVATVAALRARIGLSVDATRRGPVPLAKFLEECNLLHVTLPALTRAEIANYLRGEGIDFDPREQEDRANEWLAGFLLASGHDGYVFVGEREPKSRKDDEEEQLVATPLGRRRFTVAHELGHFILHRSRMGPWIADTHETVNEAQGQDDGAREMERQANYFAAALLMPEEVCRARVEAFFDVYKTRPRASLAYFLASELLVGPEAMRNRLQELKLGDE